MPQTVVEVSLPRRFDRDELAPFFSQLDAAIDFPEVAVDFSTLSYSCPTAMLVAGSKLRKWVAYRASKGLISIPRGINHGITALSYLMHLGFFDFINIGDGNKIGQAKGSHRYLPITRIAIPPYNPTTDSLNNWREQITNESRRIAGVLAGSHDDSEELRTYTYSIREVIRNVFEHSQANECFICGQRWYNGQAEIAIIDEGVGISRTIQQAYNVRNDAEAIDIALKPGASRINRLSHEQNIYDNSGFGLYVLSNLAASFGWFVIGSGSARIIGFDNTVRQTEVFSFSGTFFGMHLNSQPQNFRGVLRDIVDAGETESRQAGIIRRASSLSRWVE